MNGDLACLDVFELDVFELDVAYVTILAISKYWRIDRFD